MADFLDYIGHAVSGAPGAGTIMLGAALSGLRAFPATSNAKAYDIEIRDGTGWEIARDCVYTHSGTTLTRGTFVASSTGSPLSLTSAAEVRHSPIAYRASQWSQADWMSGLANTEIAITGAATATIGRMHVCSGTSADYTLMLPAAAGNAGKTIGIRMDDALTRLVTLDGNASETINGALTRIMHHGESAILLCDGAGWKKIGGVTIPMFAMASGNGTMCNNGVSTVDPLVNATRDNTGLMVDTITNKRINILRPGSYVVSGSAFNGSGNAFAMYASVAINGGSVTGGSAQGVAYLQLAIPPVIAQLNAGDYAQHLATQYTGAYIIQCASLTVQEIPTW